MAGHSARSGSGRLSTRTAIERTPVDRLHGLTGSPLATWFDGPDAIARFRRRALGQATVVLRPRDRGWRAIAPAFDAVVGLARAGVPFQTALDRHYDRSGNARVLRRALREGRTIFFPQVHQVLPRVARLMVALRVALLGPVGDECSYLFAVEGSGREGMGLHHDGDIDAFWVQLEGRRTVTIGPRVGPRTPLDLPDHLLVRDATRWRTIDLAPGTLVHLPPRTPHRVVCHGRSLAISLTWSRAGHAVRSQRAPDWDVVAGHADAIPRAVRDRLWVQVPVVAGPIDRHRGDFLLSTADGDAVRLPADVHRWATGLATMPSLRRGAVPAGALDPLVRSGILAPADLPLVVRPANPRNLDGRHFA